MVFRRESLGVRRAVNFKLNDNDWNVNCYPVSDANDWNEGNHFVSPAIVLFLPLFGGSFCLKPFFPATQHSADFLEFLSKPGEFFGWNQPALPSKLNKEFKHIKF